VAVDRLSRPLLLDTGALVALERNERLLDVSRHIGPHRVRVRALDGSAS
jgi:hypothetical protein